MIDQTIWALMRKVSHHNSKLAREARLREDIANNQIPPQVQELPWDCDPVRLGEECPLDRRCRAEKDGVYSAKVTRLDDNTSETYTGMHKGEFKGRWYAHRQNISHRNQRTKTKLATHVWNLKDSRPPINYNIKCKIIFKMIRQLRWLRKAYLISYFIHNPIVLKEIKTE